MAILQQIVTTTQAELFPIIETHLGQPLSENMRMFILAVELAEPEKFIEAFEWQGQGRPRHWRLGIALAFIAKAVWNMPTTRALCDRLAHDRTLRRLCGWERQKDVPSEATFSRAFDEFADGCWPQRVGAALVKAQLGEKLIGHLISDGTDIAAREKPASKPPAPAPAPIPQGKKRRPAGSRPPKRIDLQGGRTLEENLADLPTACDRGRKRNSKGNTLVWIGYKLHVEVTEAGVPVSAILTSASVHDNQVAIALAQMSARRVTALYELKDAAYDAGAIHAYARRLGHVPIIDPAGRGKHVPLPLEKARAVRLKRERPAVERAYSDLKDNHGGRMVRVRGAIKVMAHLSFGLLVVACKALIAMLE